MLNIHADYGLEFDIKFNQKSLFCYSLAFVRNLFSDYSLTELH